MHDRRREGPDRQDPEAERRDERRGEGPGPRGGGPPDTAFLDLEMSQVLYQEASALTRVAVREIIKDAIKERLRERLGPRLLAIARIAADELADDVEANLDIEARIAARREARRDREANLRSTLFPDKEGGNEPKNG